MRPVAMCLLVWADVINGTLLVFEGHPMLALFTYLLGLSLLILWMLTPGKPPKNW